MTTTMTDRQFCHSGQRENNATPNQRMHGSGGFRASCYERVIGAAAP